MVGLRRKYGLKVLLRVSNLAKSTYFYTVGKTGKDEKNLGIVGEIHDIFDEHEKRYGYRRITLELRNRGLVINHKKVKRIMSKEKLFSPTRQAKYRSYKGEVGKVANNVINRDFLAVQPNQKWTTDVTEFHLTWGKAYLSPILDLFNGEIVAYSVSRRPDFAQTMDMLEKALKKNPNVEGLVFHSDQGWQYQMHGYYSKLVDRGIIQSMSRKGNCLDNSPMESFFGIMKKEMFFEREFKFRTYDELKMAIDNYIRYYNNDRIKTKLKGLSPVQFRQQSLCQMI